MAGRAAALQTQQAQVPAAGGTSAVMPRWAQYQRNVRVASKDLTQPIRTAVESLNAELDGSGRVLVRASGTEPLIRVLAEAENEDVAQKACASLAALVEKELG